MTPWNRERWLFGLLLVLGLGLRLLGIARLPVWLDEAFSIWVSRFSLPDSLGWIVRIDQHPPLYYLFLNGWMRIFGDSAVAVRSLSALFGFAALPFFFGAAKRLTDGRTALAALFFLAVSPFQIQYSQEARMYSLLVLGTSAALYFLSRILTEERPSRLVWAGYAASQTGVMLTHNIGLVFYPLIINTAIFAAVWLRKRNRAAEDMPGLDRPGFLTGWIISQTACLLLWIPWLVPFFKQSLRMSGDFWIPRPNGWSVYHVLQTFHLGPAGWNVPFSWLINLIYWSLCVSGIVRLWKRPVLLILLLGLFLGPIIGELLVSLKRPIFLDRTLINAALPYTLLLGAGFAAWTGRGEKKSWNKKVSILSIALVYLVSCAALVIHHTKYQMEDWRSAASFAARQTGPDDLIVFNATWTQLPFDYYFRAYKRSNEERGLPVNLFDRGILEPKMTMSDVPAMLELFNGRKRICLVYSHFWFTDPDRIIRRALDGLMRSIAAESFPGVEIRIYESVPPQWNEENVLRVLKTEASD